MDQGETPLAVTRHLEVAAGALDKARPGGAENLRAVPDRMLRIDDVATGSPGRQRDFDIGM